MLPLKLILVYQPCFSLASWGKREVCLILDITTYYFISNTTNIFPIFYVAFPENGYLHGAVTI
jgi:hypothetical protein